MQKKKCVHLCNLIRLSGAAVYIKVKFINSSAHILYNFIDKLRNKSKFIECEKSIKNVFVNMLKTIYYKYGNYNIAYFRIITSKTVN